MTEIREQLARLAELPKHRLRIEWRRAFRGEPPDGLSRDLLLHAVAYKLQEHLSGGLSQTTKRTLHALAGKMDAASASGARSVAPTIMPGVRLVRDWHGHAHTVLVLEDGFEYGGERYRSLTEIAHRVTGARWSGPRFFGLTSAKDKPGSGRTGGPTAEGGPHGQA